MSVTVGYTASPANTSPWAMAAMSFTDPAQSISRSGLGGSGSSFYGYWLNVIVYAAGSSNPMVGDLVTITCLAVITPGTGNTLLPVTMTDTSGNIWNAGPSQFVTDSVTGNMLTQQMFWSILTNVSSDVIITTTNIVTTFDSSVVSHWFNYQVWSASDAISYDTSAFAAGVNGAPSVTFNPAYGQPLIYGSLTAFNDNGSTFVVDTGYTAIYYGGNATPGLGTYAAEYLLYLNPPPPMTTTNPCQPSSYATLSNYELTVDLDADWGDQSTFYITQDQPLPFTLRGLVWCDTYNPD